MLLGFARHRRVDAVGVLGLAGVAVATILGLVTGNEAADPRRGVGADRDLRPRLPRLAMGRPPLTSIFALEFIGANAPGRDLPTRLQYAGFRRVSGSSPWSGVTYLAEAAARVVIIEVASTGTALTVSKIMPYAVAALLIAWTNLYGQRAKRRGERLAAPAQHRARPGEGTARRGRVAGPSEIRPAAPAPISAQQAAQQTDEDAKHDHRHQAPARQPRP